MNQLDDFSKNPLAQEERDKLPPNIQSAVSNGELRKSKLGNSS